LIADDRRTQAIWAEKNMLCFYSTENRSIQKSPLSDAKYISVVSGSEDHFAVVHRWEDDRVEISAHIHSDPRQAIARATMRLSPHTQAPKLDIGFDGDYSVWTSLPRAFIVYAFETANARRLLLLRGNEEDNFQELRWHGTGYDNLYQGLLYVVEIPNRRELIITIQRDSNPVLYDPMAQKIVRKLSLADRRGNPKIVHRRSANELWVSDYDTIVKLDANTLDVNETVLIQEGTPPMERLFIGQFCFDAQEESCLVARPFSGDAVMLDADSMRKTNQFPLGGTPLDICLLTDGTVLTREWKTDEIRVHQI
jgi:hypothetical protein